MDREYLYFRVEQDIKENILKIKLKEKEFINMKMEIHIADIGKIT